MFTPRSSVWTLAILLSAACAALPVQAVASSKKDGTEASSTAKKPKKEKKAKAAKPGTVTFHEGSGETRAERERRLMRECKGRPNAGLCEGFARP